MGVRCLVLLESDYDTIFQLLRRLNHTTHIQTVNMSFRRYLDKTKQTHPILTMTYENGSIGVSSNNNILSGDSELLNVLHRGRLRFGFEGRQEQPLQGHSFRINDFKVTLLQYGNKLAAEVEYIPLQVYLDSVAFILEEFIHNLFSSIKYDGIFVPKGMESDGDLLARSFLYFKLLK
ncbi:hypothetical protein P9112_014214 [Eukaryota sp. TZLM1-RC]